MRWKRRDRVWRVCAAAVLLAAGAATAAAPRGSAGGESAVASAVSRREIDVGACRAVRDGVAAPAAEKDVLGVLGIRGTASWSAGRTGREATGEHAFRYLLAFRREVEVGGLHVVGPAGEAAALRAGAPWPPRTETPEDWQALDVPANHSGGRLITPPRPLKTRALLLTDRRKRGTSRLEAVRVLGRRLANVMPAATAYADREHTVHPGMSSPFTLSAMSLVTGRRYWQSAGEDREGRWTTPPVSDVHPSWVIVAWPSPRRVRGLWLTGNVRQFELHRYAGPAELNPRVATEAEWRPIEPTARVAHGDGRWLAFAPLTTRGLRVRITSTKDRKFARLDGLHVFAAAAEAGPVGDGAGPGAPPAGEDAAPLLLEYDLPAAGTVTVAIDDASGRRVRNLTARAPRPGGANAEPWDLRGDAGRTVPPGRYRWKAIWHPPLELRYRMCPYPNVRGASPWLNGHAGPGGWLADHTPPAAACATADRVYLGAPCAESGVSFIECDLDGRKLWGKHSFAAWTGPRRLATDGETVFVANGKHDVWSVDIATKKVAKVFSLAPSATRKGRIVGLAAREGKVYAAFRAGDGWLVNACGAGDVDFEACTPSPPEQARGGRIEAEPRRDLLRLLRLTGSPPGMPDSRGSMTYLTTQRGSGPRQHLVVAFRKPVPVGSVVCPFPPDKELSVRFAALKPGAPWPPRPKEDEDWQAFAARGRRGRWDAVAAPAGTRTRALRVTVQRGADDIFTDAGLGGELVPLAGSADSEAVVAVKGGKTWAGRIEGLKLLRRRYENVAPAAKVRVNSGRVNDDGSWDARRDEPVRQSSPGIYVLQWDRAQPLRGLAIREIDGKTTKIDVYTGDAAGDVPLSGQAGWREVATYTQPLRDYYQGTPNRNEVARYLDGYASFGGEVRTRAVRLRVVEQWLSPTRRPTGLRRDQGGQQRDARRCRIFGVAALKHLGGEPPVDPRVAERVIEYDPAAAAVAREVHVPAPGELAFAPDGRLHAVSGGRVVRVDLAGGPAEPLELDVLDPGPLAFDAGGNLYVFDRDESRCNVRVFAPDGRGVRTVGEPGPHQPGPWRRERTGRLTALALDGRGQLWAVSNEYWPKRITRWGPDGAFRQEYLGPTQYGGGGALDAGDKTRLFYGPLEFALDWEGGTTRLAGLTRRGPTPAEDLALRVGGRTYLVTRASGHSPDRAYGQVFLYEAGRCRLVAAMGEAQKYPLLNNGEMLAALGRHILTGLRFTWSDRDGDGKLGAEEVRLFDHGRDEAGEPRRIPGVTRFAADLSCQAGPVTYRVAEFLGSGVPVYEQQVHAAVPPGAYYRTRAGNLYRMGDGRRGELDEGVITPDGEVLWSYATEGRGVHSLYSAGPRTPGQVVAQFGCVGHETAAAGDLGEFLVFHSNVGTWNIWTADGLLAGRIFRDIRDPNRRAWSMQGAPPGLDVSDVTAGQEHFQGHFCRAGDGRYYVVAGHNHASVVEVIGIDRFRRYGGTVEVTPETIRRALAHKRRRARETVYRKAPVLDCPPLGERPRIDGDPTDWPGQPAATIDVSKGRGAAFRIGVSGRDLLLCWQVRGLGPMKNTGNDWRKAFKSGAAVDVQLSTDPAADPRRGRPVAGDKRLLLTWLGGEPTAVLYEPVAPDAEDDAKWKVVSPVSTADFDSVSRPAGVRMAKSSDGDGYVVEASLPLKALGLDPSAGRLKLDWGVLVAGSGGHEVLQRLYWANPATSIVSDAPSEARLHPALWGHVRFGAGGDAPAAPGEKPAAKDAIDELLKGIP